MMIIFLRAVSLGTNRSSGARAHAAGTAAGTRSSKVGRAGTPYLADRRVESAPSLLQLAAYLFANGSLLGGPFFEYGEWEAFVCRDGPFYEVRLALFDAGL